MKHPIVLWVTILNIIKILLSGCKMRWLKMIETCFLKELLKSIFTENSMFFSQTNLFAIKIDHRTCFQPFKTEIYVNQFKQSFVLRWVVNCTEIGVRCLIKVVVSPSFRLMRLKLYLLVVICRLQSYSTPTRYPKWE